MTKIVAFSGKKQSGKNTSANYLLATLMAGHKIVQGECIINPKDGRLWISDLFGREEWGQGYFDYYRDNEDLQIFLDEHIHPYIKLYAFADILKEMCVNILGLKKNQVYGSEEDKNSLTYLKWKNMPGITKDKLKKKKSEYMSAREVMQYVGTEIFRKMYDSVWAESTIRRILKENTELAIITDCRFPNEVKEVQKAGGKVIRFTRNPIKDNHHSETALDNYKGFDAVIDNKNMSISEQNKNLHKLLHNWEFIGEAVDTQELNKT